MGEQSKIKQFGLFGKNLTHSFSKAYFTKKFKVLDKNYSYQNFEFPNEKTLADFLLEEVYQLSGFNVTIPYKEIIIPYLDKLDDSAKEINAVNTVLVKDNTLIGYNTDHYGFLKSLVSSLKPQHKNALILGTGGAAKAVAYALKTVNIKSQFVSRNPKKKNILSYQELDENTIKTHQIIINTTPLGMFPNTKESPLIPYQNIDKQHLVYDLIYNPKETLFLKKAKEQAALTINGLNMLQLQAEKAWAIWNAE